MGSCAERKDVRRVLTGSNRSGFVARVSYVLSARRRYQRLRRKAEGRHLFQAVGAMDQVDISFVFIVPEEEENHEHGVGDLPPEELAREFARTRVIDLGSEYIFVIGIGEHHSVRVCERAFALRCIIFLRR